MAMPASHGVRRQIVTGRRCTAWCNPQVNLGIRTQHVVGMVANPADTGYLMVDRHGRVFTFGKTKFYGSLPGIGVKVSNIVGIALTRTRTAIGWPDRTARSTASALPT
jgi:hypothetical protein